jgi:hypothetical protein
MKPFLQKIFAFVLSLVVIVSSMSFTIDKHYCGDHLVDVAYFGKANDCGMGDMKMNEDSQQKKKKKCCKNETEFIESSTLDKEKLLVFTAENLQFFVFHIYSYINLYQDVEPEKEFYNASDPPDLVFDLQVLHETFLI